MSGLYCSKCEKPLEESHTADDLQGNLRQYYKCPCGTEVYAIEATAGDDDDENGVTEVESPNMPGVIIAHFVPQAWVNDLPMQLDEGHKYFDVTEKILAMGKERALELRDDRDETDDLIPQHMRDHHDGPFYIEVEDQIRDYFDGLQGTHPDTLAEDKK